MKEKTLYVIGTDTDAGKTFFTSLFGALLKEEEPHTAVLKPIASGAKHRADGSLYSEDGEEIRRLLNAAEAERKVINPLCIEGEFSPKIAAKKSNIVIDMDAINDHIQKTIKAHDYTIIEGAGGVLTPFTDTLILAEHIQQLGCPVILVSDGRLGSVNRAGLTVHYCRSIGIPVLGIIINDVDHAHKELLESNIEEIKLYTKVPIFSVLPAYTGPKDREAELEWARSYIPVKEILSAWQEATHE